MTRDELTMAIAAGLIGAMLLGWVLRWIFGRLNAPAGEPLAERLRAAEAEVAETRGRLERREAELAAAQARVALAEARAAAEVAGPRA